VLMIVFCVDIVYLYRAFDKVPHQRLLEKLKKHGVGGKLLGTGYWNKARSLY